MFGRLFGGGNSEIRGWLRERRNRRRRKQTGVLRIEGDRLVLSGKWGTTTMPLDGLRLWRSRFWGGPIVFSHRTCPGRQICTGDEAVFKLSAFRENEELRSQLPNCRVFLRRARKCIRWSLAAFILLMVFVPPARQIVTDQAVTCLPTSWDRNLGDGYFQSIRASGRLVTNPELQRPVDEIAAVLIKHLPAKSREFPIRFHIMLRPEVNAFALPGGHIVLFGGLLLEAESPEEIAGVMAHEIAHVVRRHSLRRLTAMFGLRVLICAVTEDLRGDSGYIWRTSKRLAELKFSRDDEFEADDTALDLLQKAGIRPDGYIRLFERLSAKRKLPDSTRAYVAEAMLSTHPMPHDRMQRLKAAAAAWKTPGEDFRPLSVDLEKIKAQIQPLLSQATSPDAAEKKPSEPARGCEGDCGEADGDGESESDEGMEEGA